MKRALSFIVPLAAMFVLAASALAQSGGTYKLLWSSVDGGGARSSGGAYVVNGAAGQPDAGKLTGGVYKLTGGFFAASLPNNAVMAELPNEEPPQITLPTNTATPVTEQTTAPVVKKRKKTATPNDDCATKLSKPKLKAPKKNARTGRRPMLHWKPVACAQTYTVVVKDALTRKKVDKASEVTKPEYKTKRLSKGREYKWVVRACNAAFGCVKSAKRVFTVH